MIFGLSQKLCLEYLLYCTMYDHEHSGFPKTNQENMYTLNKLIF